METFDIRDMRHRSGELVSEAESGRLSLVTKHGRPLFLVVPFDEALLRCGVKTTLAVGLFIENKLSLRGAAMLAGLTPTEMLDLLTERKIPVVEYSADELAHELKQFDN